MAREKEKAGKAGKRKTNLEAALEGLNGLETGAWWKPKPGKNLIRILPAYHSSGPDKGLFYNKRLVHAGIQIDGRGQTIGCISNWDKDTICPVCEFNEALMSEDDKKLQKLGKNVRQQQAFFINLIDRASGKVHKYNLKKGMMKTLRGYMMDDDYGDVTDTDEGYDLVIEKEGEGLTTKYALRPKAKPSKVGHETWEDDMFDLFADGECIEKETADSAYRKLKQAYGKVFTSRVDPPKGFKAGSEEEGEEGEEGEPAKGKGGKKGKEQEESRPDFDEMDRDELKAFIRKEELDITVKKSMSDDDIREAIEEALKESSTPFGADEED